MSFLLNAWYCAGWGFEITRKPLARTILNEKLVMYRKENGGIVALGNVCPHRFAYLHQGRLHGDFLACPYHGLQFAEGGACVHNPHGPIIPPALKVKGYPIVERHKAAWIWMGDAALADESKIPDFSTHTDPDFTSVYGLIPVKGAYQLVADNLLDLSHTQYLHSALILEDDPEVVTEYDLTQTGNGITTTFNQLNTKPFGFVDFVWPNPSKRLDSFSGIRWEAPANMRLKIHFVSRDIAPASELLMWGAELVTPETDTTCHYFWSTSRNYRLDDAAFSEKLREVIGGIFTNEDGVMIAGLQENMGDETDLIAMKPVILPTDQAAVRARRILRKLIREEAASRCNISETA